MKLFLIHFTYLILTLLNVFTNKVDATFTVADLAIVCELSNGTTVVSRPPESCTALGYPKFDAGVVSDLSSIKGTLPLMVIDDTTHMDQWPNIVQESATTYITIFKSVGVDIVAFDNMYDPNTVYKRSSFTTDIATFFDDAKCNYPDMLFGIAFCAHTNFSQSDIDVKVLNDHVDFYLLKPYVYRNCTYENHQADMANVATKDDISKTIQTFKDTGMDVTKLVYSMEIKIYSIKEKMEHFDYFKTGEDMSYSELCSKTVSKIRKFCFDSIDCFYNKASIRQTVNCTGIYISKVENDDVDGTCNCVGPDGAVERFKAVNVIAEASQNSNINETSLECVTGNFPEITTE